MKFKRTFMTQEDGFAEGVVICQSETSNDMCWATAECSLEDAYNERFGKYLSALRADQLVIKDLIYFARIEYNTAKNILNTFNISWEAGRHGGGVSKKSKEYSIVAKAVTRLKERIDALVAERNKYEELIKAAVKSCEVNEEAFKELEIEKEPNVVE